MTKHQVCMGKGRLPLLYSDYCNTVCSDELAGSEVAVVTWGTALQVPFLCGFPPCLLMLLVVVIVPKELLPAKVRKQASTSQHGR